ncbi:helix-turn-helix transcriptional regulator [Ruminococcus sp. CLA-AA-H200]|uniref:Helix-turn-helix transcriptional regulator n=1 Tax=Ruminococcus turbiniformis TaxID=2881258 RepID=A0ABS8FX10_9FIRM|nr:helix-turn-helix transcriptional regulator [Ruminococcus turbiniformis]
MKAARVNAGYTLSNVAQRLGVSKSTVSRWEHGETRLRDPVKQELCSLYGIEPENIQIIGGINQNDE